MSVSHYYGGSESYCIHKKSQLARITRENLINPNTHHQEVLDVLFFASICVVQHYTIVQHSILH